jgi:hypothetical protein
VTTTSSNTCSSAAVACWACAAIPRHDDTAALNIADLRAAVLTVERRVLE